MSFVLSQLSVFPHVFTLSHICALMCVLLYVCSHVHAVCFEFLMWVPGMPPKLCTLLLFY